VRFSERLVIIQWCFPSESVKSENGFSCFLVSLAFLLSCFLPHIQRVTQQKKSAKKTVKKKARTQQGKKARKQRKYIG